MARKKVEPRRSVPAGVSTNADERPLAGPLAKAGPRPAASAPRELKKNYAERLSRALAVLMADRLRPKFRGRHLTVTPTADEREHEASVRGAGGAKRVDVAVWHQRDGLLLDVSLKTYSFPDWDQKRKRSGRYTKNLVRNDHELRAEADRIHRRQPYAVLIGVMFMPMASCSDGESRSSFAHAVVTFRERTGRRGPDDPRHDRFERFYIGLYHYEGPEAGCVRFFDVTQAPPQMGRPQRRTTLSFAELLEQLVEEVADRNNPEPTWAEPEPDE